MTMTINANPTGCGATVHNIALQQRLAPAARSALQNALRVHRVLCFPDQSLTDDQLEAASLNFGPFGDDPFIAPIPGRKHIIAVKRAADETTPLFADSWHTDWSFQPVPPAATCLYGITIPSTGGDTLFADQIAAAAALPAALRKALEGRDAIHSAKLPYAPAGLYGEADRAQGRSMDIRADDSAAALQRHPILARHPETGEERIYGCLGYIIGIADMPDDEAIDLLVELHAHQTQEQFIYRQRWAPKMLVVWDNRSVLHRATGGYEGQERLLHRTTVAQLV